MRKVYQIEGFSPPLGIDECVEEMARDGTILLFNAGRPLAGHSTYQGTFRHGIFYAAIVPDGENADRLRNRTLQLDGWPVVFVTQEKILDDMQAYYDQHYPNQHINVHEHTIKDVIHSWLNIQRDREDDEQ